MTRRSRFGKEALVYGIGMLLSRAAALIMLPVYTRMLTPGDYGVLQLLDMTSDVVAILVSAGCTAGVMRFYFKAPDENERRAVLGSAMLLQVGLNLVGSILLFAFADPVWRHVLHGARSISLVYLAAANFSLGSIAIVPLLAMQIEKRALLYSTMSVIRLVLQLSGNILFLVVLRLGPGGILLSSFIVNVIVGAAAATWMLRRVGFVVRRDALLDLRRFGIPYQIATLGTFFVTFGDRFFLDKYSGLATVGLYGLAYQFGFMLDQMGVVPFMRAWTPRRFELAGEPQPQRDAKNARGFLYLNLLAVSCAVAIAVSVHPALRVLAQRDYWSAADIVPIILFAYVVQAWVAVVELGIDVSEKTRYATISVWASVVAALVLYAVLIPRFGGYGAAWATLLSFGVRFVCHLRFSQRLWPIAYGWRPVLRLTAIAVATSVLGAWIRPEALLLEIAAGAALFVAYALAAWTLVLHDDDRRLVGDFLSTRLRAVSRRLVPA